MRKSNNSYSKGKRWGFAVAKSSLKVGKAGVHKVDKAMQTCFKNARTGMRKLDQNERNAYRGMADGMYEAMKSEEKARRKKPQTKKLIKGRKGPERASRHKMVKRRIGQGAKISSPDNPFGMTYRQLIREEELRKRDLLGEFDYDSRGHIKGSYTPDGFFEPD